MYLDVKGYVTTGVGNLIEDVAQGAPSPDTYVLPWKNKVTGALATRDEILTEWKNVKSRQDLKNTTGGAVAAFGPITTLQLDESAIDALVMGRLRSNDSILKGAYPKYDGWPSDGQVGINSLAWAMGPGKIDPGSPQFQFKNFAAALLKDPPDFRTAATESHIKDGNADRNAAQVRLFTNAADVLSMGANPDVVYYPGTVGGGTPTPLPQEGGGGTSPGGGGGGGGGAVPPAALVSKLPSPKVIGLGIFALFAAWLGFHFFAKR